MKKIKIFSFLVLISLLSACSDEVEKAKMAMVALEKYNTLMKEKEALEEIVSGLEKKVSNLISENKNLKYQVNKYKRLYK